MASQNSPINCTSKDLEIEVIRRLREKAPFLAPECRVFRELNGLSTVLCLDFTACPQYLKMTKKEWLKFAQLFIYSSYYLGLGKALVFKIGDRIIASMS